MLVLGSLLESVFVNIKRCTFNMLFISLMILLGLLNKEKCQMGFKHKMLVLYIFFINFPFILLLVFNPSFDVSKLLSLLKRRECLL